MMLLRTNILKKAQQTHPDALHIIVPHCVNWRLTEACVATYSRLTERPHSITVVNNFDLIPQDLQLLKNPDVTVISHERTLLGKLLFALRPKRHGSKENALALDAAMRVQPQFKWGFMSHTDSAPLVRGWDRYFFQAMGDGKIIGGFRDTIRVHAAHASGTLFHQETLVKNGISLRPVYEGGKQILDVGDQASVILHPDKGTPVPVLPNTWNDETLVPYLQTKFPDIGHFTRDRSQISLDASRSFPVFCHLGRGTPRSMQDPKYSHKIPHDLWIEYISSIR